MTAAKRRARESALLMELQRDHGYALSLLPEKDSTALMVALPTSKTKKTGTLRGVRCVKLAAPADSALGRALVKDARKNRKPHPDAARSGR